MGTAAITGSASGIGAAVRERLEREGDRVIGVDIRSAEVEADLSTPDGRTAAVQQVLERSGGRLDRLVLCAGLGGHLPDIRPVARVNYFGAVELLDGLRKALEAGERPAAVVICSNSAQFGPFEEHPFVQALLDHDEERAISLLGAEDGFLAYGGSKHALCRALRRRAAEWGAAGVRLNGVAPGATETPLLQGSIDHPTMGEGVKQLPIPLGRFATPPEIAAMVAFLLGPEASFVHGSIVYVDGGSDAAIRPDRF